MTRPKRPAQKKSSPQRPAQKSSSAKIGASKTGTSKTGTSKTSAGKTGTGSRARGPQKSAAKGRDGKTREATRVAREPGVAPEGLSRPDEPSKRNSSVASGARRYGSTSSSSSSTRKSAATGRSAAPKTERKKPLPELRRVQLTPPPPETAFTDRDGQKITFPDSNLRRVAAQILSEKRKVWRYRPFSFPLFTDKGHEQAFHFDFYIYDAEDSVIRLILVVPSESREVWDKIGRFKRQYPMYTYELWTPEKLHQMSGPRGKLGW